MPAKAFVVLFFLLVLLHPRGAAAEEGPGDSPGELEEVYLSFSYVGVVDTFISARASDDAVYLPIGELFSLLQINKHLDVEAQIVRGFFIETEHAYELDFARRRAVVSGMHTELEEADFWCGESDIYMHPELLERLFGLRLALDLNKLSVVLQTDQETPLALAKARAWRHSQLHDPFAPFTHAPLRYGRERKGLGGGVLDYSFTSSRFLEQTLHSLALSAGVEVLGGDLRWEALGSSTPEYYLSRHTFQWRYVLDDNPALTQFHAGHLISGGLRSMYYRGVALTNQPAEGRTLFATYPIEGRTQPGWEVELYLNDRLVGFAEADASGHYRFVVPLAYGTTSVRVKCYGPTGEIVEERQRLEVPFTFLPRGEMGYTVNAGQRLSDHQYFSQANVALGLTDRLTGKVGIDYVRDTLFAKPVLYSGISTRLGSRYLVNLDAAPAAFYGGILNAVFPTQASVQLRYTRFADNPIYNWDDRSEEIATSGYLPFYLKGVPVNVKLTGVQQRYMTGCLYRLYANVSAGFGRFRLFLPYHGLISKQRHHFTTGRSLLSPAFSYTFPQGASWLAYLHGTMLRVETGYHFEHREMVSGRIELMRNISSRGRLHLMLDRDFRYKSSMMGIRFSYDLSSTRSTTALHLQKQRAMLTQSMQGSVAWDQGRDRLLFHNRHMVGRSAASMRLFLDQDGDGKYDAGEQIVKNARVELKRGGVVRQDRSEIIRIYDLLPYTQYTAEIDETSIANPFWVPAQPSFSFITDPNAFKPIDLPLLNAGTVEGGVMRAEDSEKRPIPGIKIHIQRTDGSFERTLVTFSDGTFYAVSLPPGRYEARIDSLQLAQLDLQSDPARLSFTVENDPNGDYLDGLDFTLRKAEIPPSTPITTSKNQDPAPPNTRKPIDLLPSAGIVEGSVVRIEGGERKPVPGIKVHLRRTDGSFERTLVTFSDGIFYNLSLPPGRYEAHIDSLQLAQLDLQSDPARLSFTVENDPNGDYLDGLDFTLRKAEEHH